MTSTIIVQDREELILLLCEAAEFEHAVMCTYLYAFFVLYTFFVLFRLLHLDAYFFTMISLVYPLAVFFSAWLLAFELRLRLDGIIWGLALATNVMVVIFFFKIFRQTDWEAQATHESKHEALIDF